jgi:hypothetical protein
MRVLFYILFFLLSFAVSFADSSIKDLEKRLETAEIDDKIIILNKLAELYSDKDAKRAIDYATKAAELSKSSSVK